MIDPKDIPAAIRATWPPARTETVGPFLVSDGAGGGNRVSAAQLADPATDGGEVSAKDIAQVLDWQHSIGGESIFMVFGWQTALDDLLAAQGFTTRDATNILACPTAELAKPPPPVSCFEIWPPLAVQEEIWADGGIGPARLAIMTRAKEPKTTLFGRINDKPAGTAFVALHERIAMLHALDVAALAQRQGLGRTMMGAAAAWARDHGSDVFSILVTQENAPAERLYASLGMQAVESYWYRVK